MDGAASIKWKEDAANDHNAWNATRNESGNTVNNVTVQSKNREYKVSDTLQKRDF